EISEEVRIRLDHKPRVVGAQSHFVSLHRAVEAEEVRIFAIRFGEDAVALGITFTPDFLRLGLRVGHQNGYLPISARLDLLRALAALGAELCRLTLALGLHTLIDRLAVLLGQVRPTNADVDDVDAKLLGLVVELLAYSGHQLRPFVTNHVRKR